MAVKRQKQQKREPKKRGPKGRPPSRRKRNGDIKFGLRVAKARIKLEMTQKALGERLGISQEHVCNVEKGTKMPSDSLRQRMSLMLLDKAWVGSKAKRAPA